MMWDGRNRSHTRQRPDFHRAVVAARRQRFSIGRKCHRLDVAIMSDVGKVMPKLFRVPDMHGVIDPTSCDQFSVGRKRHTQETAGLGLSSEWSLFPIAGIPEN
jgi:hypothetical protein